MRDAIIAIVPSKTNKESLSLALTAAMPDEGDTSFMRVRKPLASHNMRLVQVNARYIKKHGAAYNLFQERKCRLVVRMKLTSLDGHQIMNHAIGWDGKILYDKPYNSVVSEMKDRSSREMSDAVFEKLYDKLSFKDWQIVAIYELVEG